MDNDFILKLVIGIAVAIISYFLKSTMTELKEVKASAAENRASLEVLKVDYGNKFEHLTEKVSELKETLNDLIREIRVLNKSMHSNSKP